MIPLDFRHVRARSRIGKNNLPGGPGPQGPTHPLEAPGGFRQGLPRRGPLEPASVEVLDEGQPPQTQSETGQVHKAQEGQRRRARVVPNPPWCFKSRMVSAIEKRAPSISMLWSADSARSVLTKTSGSWAPSSTTTRTFWATSRSHTSRTTHPTSVSFPYNVGCTRVGVSAVTRVANVHVRP